MCLMWEDKTSMQGFGRKCLHCHQKSAVCKYTSLATTLHLIGIFVTVWCYSLWFDADCNLQKHWLIAIDLANATAANK